MPTDISILALKIRSIRFGNTGKVLFEYQGQTIEIPEPKDRMLVGEVGAQQWIAQHYARQLDRYDLEHS